MLNKVYLVPRGKTLRPRLLSTSKVEVLVRDTHMVEVDEESVERVGCLSCLGGKPRSDASSQKRSTSDAAQVPPPPPLPPFWMELTDHQGRKYYQ
jgi:hypothetical protein